MPTIKYNWCIVEKKGFIFHEVKRYIYKGHAANYLYKLGNPNNLKLVKIKNE